MGLEPTGPLVGLSVSAVVRARPHKAPRAEHGARTPEVPRASRRMPSIHCPGGISLSRLAVS
jgi:hypothetical protein